MLRTMMRSKIHRATATQADLHYVGSVTVEEDLLDAAERGSGVIGINGADPAAAIAGTGLVRGDHPAGR